MNFAAQPMLQPLYSTGFAPPPINMQPPLNLQHSFQPRSNMLSPITSQPQIILQQTSPTLPQQIQFPPSATQNLTPAPSSQIDDVPQPKPPTGWSLVGSSTSIDQTYTTLHYTYEYIFSPTTLSPTTSLPANIKPPSKPQGWVAEKSTLTIDKDPKQHTYRYVLTYYEPDS